ncbi:hypothetical protein TSO352_04780 [Azospirillum sp. TSO35-2]|nr:hypothetical protein TSO352_04780 [Azospirillum sp. TSO35-2]
MPVAMIPQEPEAVRYHEARWRKHPTAVLYRRAGIGRLPLHVMRWSRSTVLLDLQDAARGRSRQGLDVWTSTGRMNRDRLPGKGI